MPLINLPDKNLFRPKEVADYLQVSIRTIYQWITEGKIEAVRIAGTTLRISREAIIAIISDDI
jgi:excisionase family DNA binding protein